MIEREWCVHIGPPRGYVLNMLFVLGEPVQFPAERTLAQNYNSSSDNYIVLSSVIGLADEGVFYLQSEELKAWFSYRGIDIASGRLLSVVMDRGVQGTYLTGVQFQQWIDISDRVITPITLHAWEEENIYDWRADMQGNRYNSLLMPPDASVLLETRVITSTDMSPTWRLAAKGYVRSWQSIGDAQSSAHWSCTVESVRTYIQSKKIKSQQFGRSNLAKNSSVTASGTLLNATLEPQEFAGGLADIEPSNTVDEIIGTLWISDEYPSLDEEPLSEIGYGNLVIDEVMVHGPPGAPVDLQYVVIRLPKHMSNWNEGEDGGKDVRAYGLCNKDTVYYDIPWDEYEIMEDNYVRLPRDVKLNNKNPLLVLCRNLQVFSEYFSQNAYDWRDLEGFGGGKPGANFILHDIDKLELRLTMKATNFEPVVNRVKWSSTPVSHDTVQLPPNGFSMRRFPPGQDTSLALDWIHEDRPAPGNDRSHRNDNVWISVELPSFNCALNDAITSVYPGPGAWLYVSDTHSLPANGTIQINTEQIYYSQKKSDIQALLVFERGANSTIATSHGAQATIRLVEFGEAHTRQSISTVEICRQLVLDDAGNPVVPRTVFLWASNQNTPRYPGASGYRADWIGNQSIKQLSNESALVMSADLEGSRYKHIMFRIDEMSDKGRTKINDIRIWGMAREAKNDERGAGQVVRDIFENILKPNEILIDRFAFKDTISDMQINEGGMGGVIEEILKRSAAAMRYEYDGTVSISRHPSHPLASRPDIAQIFELADIKSPAQVTRPSRITSPQIIIEAFNARGEYAEGRFPPVGTDDAQRISFEIDIPTEEIASRYARMLYLQQDGVNKRYVCELVGASDDLHAGDRIWLRDVSDLASESYFQGRITAVTHGGEKGNTKLECIEWRML